MKQKIIYVTPKSFFTINPYFYIPFYIYLLFLILGYILFFVFIASIKTYKDSTNHVLYSNVNLKLILTSFICSIFSIISILISLSIFIRTFSFRNNSILYLLCFCFLLSFILFIISISYYSKKYNLCPNNQEFSKLFNKCIPICNKGQIYDSSLNKCVEGCNNDNDCSSNQFCCIDSTPKKCSDLTQKCGDNHCCDPSLCNEGNCCPKERIKTDKSCCPPNTKSDGTNCIGSCGNLDFDIKTQQCVTVYGDSKDALQSIHDLYCKDSEIPCNDVIYDDSIKEYSFSYVTSQDNKCKRSADMSSFFPSKLGNFFLYAEANKISSDYFCYNKGDINDVKWATLNSDTEEYICDDGYIKSLFIDGNETQLNNLYTIDNLGIFCGNDPNGLQALASDSLLNCSDNNQFMDTCIQNAYANTSRIDTNINDQKCFYTLNPIDSNYSPNLFYTDDDKKNMLTKYEIYKIDSSGKESLDVKYYTTPNTINNVNEITGYNNDCSIFPKCSGYSQDCCPTLIQKDSAISVICEIKNGDYGIVYNYIPPPPIDITNIIRADYINTFNTYYGTINFTPNFNDSTILIIATAIDNGFNVVKSCDVDVYTFNFYNTSHQSSSYQTSNIRSTQNVMNFNYVSICLEPFIKYTNSIYMKAGKANSGGSGSYIQTDGQYKARISYDIPFPEGNEIIVIAGQNGTRYDLNNIRASVYCWNTNSSGFDFWKTYYYCNNVGSCATRNSTSDIFDWWAINKTAIEKNNLSNIIQCGTFITNDYCGYVKFNHSIDGITDDNALTDLIVLTTLNNQLDSNASDVPSIMVTKDKNGFAYVKNYINNDDSRKKLESDPFNWVAFNKNNFDKLIGSVFINENHDF